MVPASDRLSRLPYWLLATLLLAVLAFWTIANNANYRVIFAAVSKGVWTTIYVSFVAYILAILLGLVWTLMRVSKVRLLQEVSSFFVEIIRGIPMLVLLYFIFFVGAPLLVSLVNWLGGPLIRAGMVQELNIRQVDYTVRAIMALTVGYSAFISEIFRAGIEFDRKRAA